jgi:chromosome segregation ATPase
MTDNSEALRRTRRQDSRTKRQRATETIISFEQGGEPVSFPAIARRAGVSVSLLYSDPELASRIATARDRQRQAGRTRAWQLPARSLLTEQSLHAELANTKEQTRQLTEEVTVLRQRLARQLGADADLARGHTTRPMLDQLEERSAELEADNHTLRQRVAQLQGELSERTDTLDAARAMNRELMNELNRDAPNNLGGVQPGSVRR